MTGLSSIPTYAGVAAAAYLIGAIPFSYLIGRWRGVDIRRVGSGNVGATNVFRSVGKGWGILAFVCDALKGYLPVRLLPILAPAADPAVVGMLALCGAMAGHTWPVYLKFKGGKGVATSAGALLALAPLAMLCGLAVWVTVFLAGRYVSVASIAAAVTVAVCAWPFYLQNGWGLPLLLTVLGLLVIWRHRSNMQRLRQGTEHRFRFGKKKERT